MSWKNQITASPKMIGGENTLVLTGEPEIKTGQYGLYLYVPTNAGAYKFKTNSDVAGFLKIAADKFGDNLTGLTMTIIRNGTGAETNYVLKSMEPPSQHLESKPKVESTLNAEQQYQAELAELKKKFGKN